MKQLRTLFLMVVCALGVSTSASGQFLHRQHGGIFGHWSLHGGGGHVVWPHHQDCGPLAYPTNGYDHFLGHGHSYFELRWYAPPSLIVLPWQAAPLGNFNRPPKQGRRFEGRAALQEQAAAAAGNNAMEAVAAPRPLLFQPRTSNKTSRRRAAKYIAYGDTLFAKQKEHSALQRYKAAAKAAPDLAQIYFRQGFALLATHRYDLAAAAFKRGLALAPADGSKGGFVTVDALYQDNLLAKESHLDALSRTVAQNPHNADYWFVLGMFLRHDGQAQRADKFFQHAQQLSGGSASHLNGLLKKNERKKQAEKNGLDA